MRGTLQFVFKKSLKSAGINYERDYRNRKLNKEMEAKPGIDRRQPSYVKLTFICNMSHWQLNIAKKIGFLDSTENDITFSVIISIVAAWK